MASFYEEKLRMFHSHNSRASLVTDQLQRRPRTTATDVRHTLRHTLRTSYAGADLTSLMSRKPVSSLLAVTLTLAATWTTVVVSLLLVSALQAAAACLGSLGDFAKQLVMACLSIIALGLFLLRIVLYTVHCTLYIVHTNHSVH